MKKTFFAFMITLLSVFPVTYLYADDSRDDDSDDEDTLVIYLSGMNDEMGKARIEDNPEGVDTFRMKVWNLKPHTRYSVFLTESATPGALPAQFLGEFRTNKKGKGKFKVRTEIINAFASSNVALDDDGDGIVDVPGAGALGKGATTIPLNWIRVYPIPEMGGNVFGASENEFGGKPVVLTSEEALP